MRAKFINPLFALMFCMMSKLSFSQMEKKPSSQVEKKPSSQMEKKPSSQMEKEQSAQMEKNPSILQPKVFFTNKEIQSIINEIARKIDSIKASKETKEIEKPIEFCISFTPFYDYFGKNFTYYLRGDSNPNEVRELTYGLMLSPVLSFKFGKNRKSAIFISVPIAALNLKDETYFTKIASFSTGFTYKCLGGASVGFIVNFDSVPRLPETAKNGQLFFINAYPSLAVGRKIPDEILKDYLKQTPKVVFSVTVNLPILIFKNIK